MATGINPRAVKLSWSNLNYSVKINDPESKDSMFSKSEMVDFKVIKDVSGFALPG